MGIVCHTLRVDVGAKLGGVHDDVTTPVCDGCSALLVQAVRGQKDRRTASPHTAPSSLQTVARRAAITQ